MQLEIAPLLLENIRLKITLSPTRELNQLHGYGLEICERWQALLVLLALSTSLKWASFNIMA